MNAVVTLTVESTHTYFLSEVASLEEAESLAEDLLLEDNDQGEAEYEIIEVESYEDEEEKL